MAFDLDEWLRQGGTVNVQGMSMPVSPLVPPDEAHMVAAHEAASRAGSNDSSGLSRPGLKIACSQCGDFVKAGDLCKCGAMQPGVVVKASDKPVEMKTAEPPPEGEGDEDGDEDGDDGASGEAAAEEGAENNEGPPVEKSALDAWLQKSSEGEGSRGGHVIGHTSSGKPIYETHDHSSHSSFSSEDHNDAAALHKTKELAARAEKRKHMEDVQTYVPDEQGGNANADMAKYRAAKRKVEAAEQKRTHHEKQIVGHVLATGEAAKAELKAARPGMRSAHAKKLSEIATKASAEAKTPKQHAEARDAHHQAVLGHRAAMDAHAARGDEGDAQMKEHIKAHDEHVAARDGHDAKAGKQRQGTEKAGTEKSMSTNDLADWLQKAGIPGAADEGTGKPNPMPEGNPPLLDERNGMSGVAEVKRVQDGGKVAGVGAPSGSPARGQGAGVAETSGAKKKDGGSTEVLSDDDQNDTDEMKSKMGMSPSSAVTPGAGMSNLRVQKGIDHQRTGFSDPMEAQHRHAYAVGVAAIRAAQQPELVELEGLPPIQKAQPPPLQFRAAVGPNGVLFSDLDDRLTVAALQKGEEPMVFHPETQLNTHYPCASCGTRILKALSSCPQCGRDHGQPLYRSGDPFLAAGDAAGLRAPPRDENLVPRFMPELSIDDE